MWTTWSQPRTRCSQHPKRHCGTSSSVLRMYVRSIAAREIAGPLKPVPSPSRSLAPPPPYPVSTDGLPWMADQLCCMREFVVQRKRWLSRSSNGTAFPIPREVVEAGRGPSNTHTRMQLAAARAKKKKSKSCRTQTAHPVKDRLASVGCGFWSCAAGTALYPDSRELSREPRAG